MIGTNSYPMKNTPKMTNRWEALVPVPIPAPELRYRIKVNWKYNAIPAPTIDTGTVNKIISGSMKLSNNADKVK